MRINIFYILSLSVTEDMYHLSNMIMERPTVMKLENIFKITGVLA